MSDIKNFEELFELINPELLTTEKSCYEMLEKVYNNRQILDDYGEKIIKRLAKLKNEKVFYREGEYSVKYIDFFVAKDENDLNSLSGSDFDVLIDVQDSINIGDLEEYE